MSLRMFGSKVKILQCHMRGCATFSGPKVATVGIDFGCKNSRVAIIDTLVPHVVQSEIGCFTPSYVTSMQLNPDVSYPWGLQNLNHVGKHIAVGELAKQKMLKQPSDVAFNIKKLIGKQFGDSYIQEMRKRVHFGIIEGPRGEAWVELQGKEFSPVEIASVIFAKLRDLVLMYQFHHKLRVVISVPAFFNEQQREDILSAGNKAGLEVPQLIDESIAAALSSSTIEKGIVAVFSMGAGSYSVTILHVSGTNFEVKTQFGDPSIGGDQFDDILVDYFVTQIIKLHSIDIRGDRYAMTELAEEVEQAKVDLSSQSTATVSISCISAQGPAGINITISRTEFEKLVDNLIEQIKTTCQSILKEADNTDMNIDELILIGGMARVPKIQRIICDVFGKRQSKRVNPEKAVVIGSAIQAALIVEDQQEMSEDMVPLSIGIETTEGIFTRVIPRHTKVPTKRTVRIPSWTYGESLRIEIFLGEHVHVDHNKLLGEVELVNNRSSYEGCVHFELTFEVDKDYMVKVSARDVDGARETIKTFPVREMVMCKQSVNKAVKKALLDWMTYVEEIHAHVRNMARHAMNTLDDVLSARKNEVPEDLCEDGMKALADLRLALDGNVALLKDKILAAKSVEQDILHWMPSSVTLDEDYSDYEN